MKNIILASGSPRRKELMAQAGIPFAVKVSACEETVTKEKPEEIVQELARKKAAAVAQAEKEDALVIGADTVVALNGKVMGKPRDKEEAFQMLRLLQGKTHEVWTGVCILERQADGSIKEECFAQKTEVEMYPMEETEIRGYIETGEPMDKAGAYGIQGKALVFVKKIEGDYYNVVGLLIAELYQRLKRKLP